LLDYFYGPQKYYKQYQVSGGGSGFLISDDGYILTNHHVAGNATKVVVTLTDGEKYEAEIIGSDLMSDVCLLKIN
jgi:serine protease Do